jgi:malate dehydrogenase
MKSLVQEQTALNDAINAMPNPTQAKVKAMVEADPALQATVDKMKSMGSVGEWSFSRIGSSPQGEAAMVVIAGAGTPAAAEAAFRIASGQMLGPNKPVSLQLIGANTDLVSELKACEFPLLQSVAASNDMKGAEYVLLMAGDFAALGKQLSSAAKGVLVSVVGNTNALKAATASGLPQEQFSSVTLAAQMSGAGAIAEKAGVHSSAVENVIAWGSGAVDFSHATVDGKWVASALPGFEPAATEETPEQLGSAAVAHMHAWACGSEGKWVSMGVPATDDFGMGTGFFYSVPCVCSPGEYHRVGGISISPAAADMMENSRLALLEEKAAANL